VIGAMERPVALGQGSIVVKTSAKTASAASRARAALPATMLDPFMVVGRIYLGSENEGQERMTEGKKRSCKLAMKIQTVSSIHRCFIL